jgi:4-hydroxy-L-threonine phosphate dehydrogenase PdxA
MNPLFMSGTRNLALLAERTRGLCMAPLSSSAWEPPYPPYSAHSEVTERATTSQEAIEAMNGAEFMEQTVTVDWAFSKYVPLLLSVHAVLIRPA